VVLGERKRLLRMELKKFVKHWQKCIEVGRGYVESNYAQL
jgi:hypothetical protein